MSRRQGVGAGGAGGAQAAGSEYSSCKYLSIVADNCHYPVVVAGPISTLGGVAWARVVDCLGYAWVEVCEDYGLFVGECLRGLNLAAAELDKWLTRVAHRHCVCCGWDLYDLCLREEVGRAVESVLRLQRAAKPWLWPYADVSPNLAFEVGVLSPELGALTCFDTMPKALVEDVKSALYRRI